MLSSVGFLLLQGEKNQHVTAIAKFGRTSAVSAWRVSSERNRVSAWRYGVSACVTALQMWRNDVTAKRTETISRREHVPRAVGFQAPRPRAWELDLGSTEAVGLPDRTLILPPGSRSALILTLSPAPNS